MSQTVESPVVPNHELDSQEAKRVTYVGAWLDALLSIVKVAVGFLVGSAALIADGIHSLSDLVTDGFVLAGIHYGRQAPDDDHHYGHGRIETLTTMLLGSVLIFVAGAIAWSSMERLLNGEQVNAPGTAHESRPDCAIRPGHPLPGR